MSEAPMPGTNPTTSKADYTFAWIVMSGAALALFWNSMAGIADAIAYVGAALLRIAVALEAG